MNLKHILIYAQLFLKHLCILYGLAKNHDLLLCPLLAFITQAIPTMYFGISTTEVFIQLGRPNTALNSIGQYLSYWYGYHVVEAAQHIWTFSQEDVHFLCPFFFPLAHWPFPDISTNKTEKSPRHGLMLPSQSDS